MLSVVVITKNEEEKLRACLESVSFSDEVIVVDDESEDGTRKIARSLGAKVYKRELKNDFAAQRNFGIEKAKGKWVLFVDSDEVVSKELANEIIQATSDPFVRAEGFYLKRVDIMWGKKIRHGEVGNTKLLRLARKGSGKWTRRVHEVWDVMGRKKTLKNPIYHYPHQDLGEFLEDINKFSSLHAKANKEEGKKSRLIKILVWPSGHFVVNWILKRGILDGMRGFVIALVMSFHSFLAWSKLWIYQRGYKTD